MSSINQAIQLLGLSGIAKLYAPEISPQAVFKWARSGFPPDSRCAAIERATDGQITCESLRPDLFWVRIPDSTWPHLSGRPLVDRSEKVAA